MENDPTVTMKRSRSTKLQLSKKFKPTNDDNNDDRLAQVQEYSTVTSNEFSVHTTVLPLSHEHDSADLEYNLSNCTEFIRGSHEKMSTPRNSIWTPD